MRFLHPEKDNLGEYTFDDLFILQNFSQVGSRRDVNLQPDTPLSTTLPIISANMNSVTGKRMSETLARYGGMGVLPQDMPLDKMIEIIKTIHSADSKFDTPLNVFQEQKVRDARGIIGKRAHDAVVLVDEHGHPLGIFTSSDFKSVDDYTQLSDLKRNKKLITGDTSISYEDAYNMMCEGNISSLPIVNAHGELKGMMTKKDAIRGDMYRPSLNKDGKLNVSVALGINAYRDRIETLMDVGLDTIVLDTAHGLQDSMVKAIREVRNIVGEGIQIIAGNIITGEGVKILHEAGANGFKVGIGPGAMCTTRMQTGVGRPQFSAIKECADIAKEVGGFVWADGGIKNPRDLALALAAGASHGMIGSILAGTYESTGDIKEDNNGKRYKESHGMASGLAVQNRNAELSDLEIARKSLFREGISTSKIYMQEGRSSVGDLLDEFTTGLRSTLAYVGANDLQTFHQNVVIGVQSHAGFDEGKPRHTL